MAEEEIEDAGAASWKWCATSRSSSPAMRGCPASSPGTPISPRIHVNDIHYVNTGSWTETPCAYVTVDSKGLMLHHVSD